MLGSKCIDTGHPGSDPDPDGSRKDMGALPTYKTAPQIAQINPAASAQEVPRETVVQAVFDRPMDPITINGDNFLVTGQGGGRNGTITYDPLAKTATFTPDEPFDPGEAVQVRLTDSIASLWGLTMPEDHVWTFEIVTGTGVVTPDPHGTPGRFGLQQNYPNPFNAGTQIRFGLAAPGHVGLRVYNMLGQLVKTLVDEDLPAGEHQVLWGGVDEQGRPLASGVYFYRLEAGGQGDVRRMVFTR